MPTAGQKSPVGMCLVIVFTGNHVATKVHNTRGAKFSTNIFRNHLYRIEGWKFFTRHVARVAN